MPWKPKEAAEQSANTKLSEEESAAFSGVIDSIDHFLTTGWDGGTAMMTIPPITSRTFSAISRAYQEAGWKIVGTPLDGVTAKAIELLKAGAPIGYAMTMIPCW